MRSSKEFKEIIRQTQLNNDELIKAFCSDTYEFFMSIYDLAKGRGLLSEEHSLRLREEARKAFLVDFWPRQTTPPPHRP